MQSNSDIFLEEREHEELREDIEAQYEAWNWEDEAQEDRNEKPLSILNLFDTGLTKTDIKILAENAVNDLTDKGNPLQVAEALIAMENFIKEVKDDPRFKNYVREETAKTPKGFISKSGAKIELVETGTTYNYDQCGDVELEMLDAAFKSAEASLKERKEFLKKIPASGIDVIVPFSGEVIHIYPPAKSSTSSFKVTLSK